MAYSRAWDETFPPDTQQANLIGQDIRNGKTDLRERIASFGAGLLASRPTPEALFGTPAYGVMYFAYDTNQFFFWTGAAWIDITGAFPTPVLWTDFRIQQYQGDTAQHNIINAVNIPANTLGGNGGMRLRFFLENVETGGTFNLIFKFGGVTVMTQTCAASSVGVSFLEVEFTFGNISGNPKSNTFLLMLTEHVSGISNTNAANLSSSTIDTTVAQAFTVVYQAGDPAASVQISQIILEKLPRA